MDTNILADELDREIEFHRKQEQSESYLGKAIHYVFSRDDDSLAALNKLRDEVATSGYGTTIYDELSKEDLVKTKIWEDQRAIEKQSGTNALGATFLKTAALFTPGLAGTVSTAVLGAADRARPSDSLNYQLTDAALGATTGLLSRGIMNTSRIFPGMVVRGAILGIGTRAVETGLDRRTYINPETGLADPGYGLKSMAAVALSPSAIGMSMLTYWAAGKSVSFLDAEAGSAITRSPIARDTISGAAMGLFSGMTGELYREYRAGEGFNYSKAIGVGMKEALVTGTAALAAGSINSGVQAFVHRNDVAIPVVDQWEKEMYTRYFKKDDPLVKLFKENEASVVRISTSRAVATGFFVDSDGTFVTNDHVAKSIKDGVVTVRTSDGKTYDAQVIATNPDYDLAVLKANVDHPVRAIEMPPERLPLEKGEKLVGLGFAEGSRRLYASPGEYEGDSVISVGGNLGQKSLAYKYRALITNGSAHPGDSGGPILSLQDGKLVGVTSASGIWNITEDGVPVGDLHTFLDQVRFTRDPLSFSPKANQATSPSS